MGSGTWTKNDYYNYAKTIGRTIDDNGALDEAYTAQELFASTRLQPELNPYKVIRQCCDTQEHSKTIPVILALDVTGSMGCAAAEVAKKINKVMTELYEKVTDVEFLVMGIGDLAFDKAPIQASQFESDIRIAEQLDKIYFEGGGGGNGFESYTGAWYFGSRHTDLDCWKRGKKGIIITMGDEPLNPYLPANRLRNVTGDSLETDIETNILYEETVKKFDIYHLAVNDKATAYHYYKNHINKSFGKYLDDKHLLTVSLDNIANTIVDIVSETSNNTTTTIHNEISW